MEGLMVSGDRLYGSGYVYFDASNEQRFSHYSRSGNWIKRVSPGGRRCGRAARAGSWWA